MSNCKQKYCRGGLIVLVQCVKDLLFHLLQALLEMDFVFCLFAHFKQVSALIQVDRVCQVLLGKANARKHELLCQCTSRDESV